MSVKKLECENTARTASILSNLKESVKKKALESKVHFLGRINPNELQEILEKILE